MKHKRRSACPIATTLDILGDRWTLIVVRDLFSGKTRFGEFAASPEKITTNILAERLDRLERAGIVTRTPYQERPRRHAYRLTARGRRLKPVLQEICRWANAELPDTWTPPESFMAQDPVPPADGL